MELSDLARWTPIGVTLKPPNPTVDWCDLSGIRFSEPFFSQTLARVTDAEPPRGLVQTGLDELMVLDVEAPGRNPSGFIFHMARCGSTVLSRLLGTMPDTLVVSEAEPINNLLEADPEVVNEDALVAVLRAVVRAMGRARFGDERHYVVKLSSWNIRKLYLFRLAFPEVPWVWVYRDPVEVMASVLAAPPGWMQLQRYPRRAEYLFDLDPFEATQMPPEEFCARVLASFGAAALGGDGEVLLVDYRELPGAVWTRVAPFFGIPLTEADIAGMQVEALFYAKDPAKRPFLADSEDKRQVSNTVRMLATAILDPIHARLTELRQASPRRGQSPK